MTKSKPHEPTAHQARCARRRGPQSGEGPRQRLLRRGPGALTDAELLSLLLGRGGPRRSALEIAGEALESVGGLSGLVGVSVETLRHLGLTEAKAGAILAAVELARRLARSQVPEREWVGSPSAAASYLALRYTVPHQEVFGALYLDIRSRVLSESELYRGTIGNTLIEPREILRVALLHGASGVLVFHTHPSGDPTPSLNDVEFTRVLSKACEAIQLHLHDHLILGSARQWVSLRARGFL